MTTIAELKQRVARLEAGVARAQTAAAGISLAEVRRAVATELAAIADTPAEHVSESHDLAAYYRMGALHRFDLALRLEELLDVGPLNDKAWRTVGDVVADVARAPARA